MIRRLLTFGTTALAALVGGCGDGPSTVPGGYRSAATWSSFIHASAKGPLLLEIKGDPFAVGRDALTAVIAGSMEAAIPARPFSLTIDPAQAPHPTFRVVVALGPPKSLAESDICAGAAWTPAPPVGNGGRIEVIATFCDGTALLSSVRGWVARVEGIGDRRLRHLLGQMVRELMGDPQ
jgi:hypothetical protein